MTDEADEHNYFDSQLLDGEMEIQKEVVERNKNNPIVKLDFTRRMESWINTILPDRLHQIDMEKKEPEFINRMGSLAFNDFRRLLKRAEKEGLNKRDNLLNILLLELSKYVKKKDEYQYRVYQ